MTSTCGTGLGKWNKQPGKLKQVRNKQLAIVGLYQAIYLQVSVSGFDDNVVWGVNKVAKCGACHSMWW
jgi:hypothetical protein